MRYAFLNQDSTVVNVIVGELTPEQLGGFLDDYAKLFGATQAQFLSDYGALFGAVAIVELEMDVCVWIGGSYTGGVFAEPPQPEPLPEPQPEPQLEPEI